MQSIHTLLATAKESFLLRTSGRKRSRGGQKKRYKYTLKASYKDFNIPNESWKYAAQDRTKWLCLMNKEDVPFEAKRFNEAERKHKERRAREKGSSSKLTYSISNRQFRAKIGLNSHQRTHMNSQHSGLKMSFSILRDEQN